MKKLLLLILVFICGFKIIYAQPGSLDFSFGKKGIVLSDFGSKYNYSFKGEKVLAQQDGSFFTIHDYQPIITKRHPNGSIDSSYGNNGFSERASFSIGDAVMQPDGKIIVLDNNNFILARFGKDGNLDYSFGKQGVISATSFGGTAIPSSLAIQKDGKIVVVGSTTANDNYYFAISRYNIDGSLDNTFSNDGKVITTFGFSRPTDERGNDYPELDYATSVVIQNDGKIVVAGSAFNYSSDSYNFAIARYNDNGNLDNTFDFDGKQTTAMGSNDVGYSLTLQKDGKIILTGYTRSENDYNFAIARYNTNGSLDTSFSEDGKQITITGTVDFLFNSVAIQGDGKIVVAGHFWNGSNNDFVVTRYNLNGTPDNTFDADGKLITDFSSSDDYATSIAIQSDGKILLIGYSYTYSNSGVELNSVITRYNINGSLDKTFDGDGKLIESLNQGSTSYSCQAIQKDGKVVVGGYTWNGKNFDFIVARYNINGSLDNSFGNKGAQITDFGSEEYPNQMTIQNDGKIVIVGSSGVGNSSFSISRYNVNGSIDSTFSGDGKIKTNLGFLGATANAVAIQRDGKILVVGIVEDSSYNIGYLIVRFNINGSIDNTFGKDGMQTMPRGGAFFIGYSLVVQSDQKILVAGFTNDDLEIIRLNSNGSLDNTFDSDGIQTTDFGFSDEAANAVALQNDGKIIVAGGRRGSESEFLLARYNINGSLDTTFSSDGKQTNNFGLTYIYGASLAIQNNGNIVCAGNSVIARYNKDGSVDNSFSNNGIQLSEGYSIQRISTDGERLYTVGSGLFPGSLGVVARYLLTDNKAPTIAIVSPANNATFIAPATFTIKATATDPDGFIASVKFYNNGALLKTDSTSPYTYSLTDLAPGNYSLVAKAMDNKGLTTNSSSVSITVLATPNKAPVVSITSPSNNSVYTAPASLTINAAASDADGSISNVKFYKGGTLVKTDSTSPYTCALTNLAAGNYSVVAKATDNKGLTTNSASIAVAISVSANKAPVVSIASTTNNTVYIAPATFTLNANASDADGTVTKVQFYKGGTLLKTDSTSPYTSSLSNLAAGNYSFTAKATDNKSLSASSSSVLVTVLPPPSKAPVISITTPAVNSSYTSPATISISASASDADGVIKTVKFYKGSTLLATDSTSPYSYTLTNVAPGTYSITAKATDDKGLSSSSASVAILVKANKVPVVSITTPENTAGFIAPATITIDATASDSDGTISNVKFYNGSTYLKTVLARPYSYALSNLPVGTYILTAKATDNNGGQTISNPVTVTVSKASIVNSRPSSGNDETHLSDGLSMKLYPNPATSILNIYTQGLQQNKPATISIISSSGIVLKKMQVNSSTQSIQLDVSTIAKGVYIIKVLYGDNIMFKQFVKL